MQRRILVTGAGARIGQALSIELAKAGWQVLVHYHSSLAGASQTCAKIEEIGGTGHLVQADLSDHQQCMDLIPDLVTRFGPIHGLVNNASIFENDQLDNLEPSQWERQFAINLKAIPKFCRTITQRRAWPCDQFARSTPGQAEPHIF